MTKTRSLIRNTSLTAALAATALVLAACGDDAPPKTGDHQNKAGDHREAGNHNKADTAFAKGMIPHHRQAVEMSDLAASRASSSEVKSLAKKIAKAQGPEITTMSGWLKSWGVKVPAAMPRMKHEDMKPEDMKRGGMDHGGMDHGDSGTGGPEMPGMMDQKQLDEMKKSSGKDFDTRFLTMMVDHHKGAVGMAKAEKKQGAYGPARKLADDVISAQNSEITRMNKLLGKS
ncbi:DUF305 domain-containing protein [Streptomyces sp. NBC_01795]|uniref:DUF305 domain-containing protein n=1 Tax=Streptomyces sp. NBC_01795 TaxID=2975943 RepID=UPI002DD8E4A3|nr:DUF305 domain-containing protein [Streptomyces sp. NBC_01795]WSA91345.1 DUF305 domain-containing protein [Streptomyces sp. NBC_01795]